VLGGSKGGRKKPSLYTAGDEKRKKGKQCFALPEKGNPSPRNPRKAAWARKKKNDPVVIRAERKKKKRKKRESASRRSVLGAQKRGSPVDVRRPRGENAARRQKKRRSQPDIDTTRKKKNKKEEKPCSRLERRKD